MSRELLLRSVKSLLNPKGKPAKSEPTRKQDETESVLKMPKKMRAAKA